MKRREFLATNAALAGSFAVASKSVSADERSESTESKSTKLARQSVMGWCFKPMKAPELAKHGAAIGLKGMVGIAW